MKINVSQVIKDFNGRPILTRTSTEHDQLTELTVRSALIDALMTPLPGDEKETGQAKFDLYALASKINSAEEEVELNHAEVTRVRERCGRNFVPMIIGFLWPLFDGK